MKRLKMVETQSTINEMVQQVMSLHEYRGYNRKGYYEECAAVIYHNFKKQHKMMPRQYCMKITVSLKKFNEMYTKYKQMEKQIRYERSFEKMGEQNEN